MLNAKKKKKEEAQKERNNAETEADGRMCVLFFLSHLQTVKIKKIMNAQWFGKCHLEETHHAGKHKQNTKYHQRLTKK